MRGRSIKVAPSKSPNKISVLPQQSAHPGATPRNNRSRQSPKKSNKSIALSIKNDCFVDLDPASKLEKSRSLMDELLAGLFGQVADKLNEKQRKQIIARIKDLDKMPEFEEYLNNYFPCYNYCYAAKIVQEDHEVVKVTQDFKQKRKIFLSSEKDKSKSKKKAQIQSLNQENEQLKKQLFRLKQSNLHLQKRILQLVAQYKDRKMIYLSQIQKLATLVNTTIKEIPQLIMKERPPLDRRSCSAQKPLLPPELTLARKESEYNTLSTNDALRWGLENTYHVLDVQNSSKKGGNLQSTHNYTGRGY